MTEETPLICKGCGRNLEVGAYQGTVTCGYCGTVNVIVEGKVVETVAKAPGAPKKPKLTIKNPEEVVRVEDWIKPKRPAQDRQPFLEATQLGLLDEKPRGVLDRLWQAWKKAQKKTKSD